MRQLQPDLCRRNIGQSLRVAGLIDPGDGRGIGRRENLPVGERKIENRKIAMLMPHGRAERELSVNQSDHGSARIASERAGTVARLCASRRQTGDVASAMITSKPRKAWARQAWKIPI